ncbi:MAG: 50S ribosomal protein L6 [Parcubacteria group bacterium]|nr:50S ribosomal protein L6 [Parcubacteria group bacterium]
MSRIGKQLITVSKGVEIKINGQVVMVKGPKGSLSHTLPDTIKANLEGDQFHLSIADEQDRLQRVMWGTHASLIANMVEGVVNGYRKQLEINGVGYKVAQSGQKLTFQLGFTHPNVFILPKEIKAEVEKNVITISGIDKQLVGQVTAEIRGLRVPEPYKGKGIKYVDEVIRRKAGKAAVSAA